MPTLFDLTWKPSAAVPELPTGTYPYVAPAIYRGDVYELRFVLLDSQYATPVPYVPEGTFQAQIRTARLAAGEVPGDPLATFTVDVAGDDGNEVFVTLTAEQTALLPDQGFWDLQEAVGESVVTWYTGKVKAWGDITRVEA